MTTLVLMKDVLTEENVGELFEQASKKSKREVEILVASLKPPIQACKATLRPLPKPQGKPVKEAKPTLFPEVMPPPLTEARPTPPAEAMQPLATKPKPTTLPDAVATPAAKSIQPDPPLPAPRTAPAFSVRLVVSESFAAKLEKAKNLLSHKIPNGDLVAVLEAALDGLLAHAEKARRPTGKPPRPASPSRENKKPGQRAPVPAETARQVWQRDGHCCSWKTPSGGVCGSRWKVEIDHIVPVAKGGGSDLTSLRLLCKFHDQIAARQVFGEAFMDRARRRSASSTSSRKSDHEREVPAP